MKCLFRKSFERDVKKVKDKSVLDCIEEAILVVEDAATLSEVQGLSKLSGYQDYYRIRIGDYRIGLSVKESVVEFVRCLHRRDIYRYFP